MDSNFWKNGFEGANPKMRSKGFEAQEDFNQHVEVTWSRRCVLVVPFCHRNWEQLRVGGGCLSQNPSWARYCIKLLAYGCGKHSTNHKLRHSAICFEIRMLFSAICCITLPCRGLQSTDSQAHLSSWLPSIPAQFLLCICVYCAWYPHHSQI